MAKVIITTRPITISECPWLDADIPEGTTLWTYDDHAYGCISPNGRAVSAKAAETPFFEIPQDSFKETSS